ncbi:trypsin-like peptidase domain-containing protein [Cohnella sp. LGH]|uniref:S1C family serine protease n=1 Tax=unclassified Cohnella TaxID=2636738 RepID=UPI001ADA9A1A|nr:trypsin-like peptidase domain-containing protein [Cohnella sp. LGH]QTH42853.1 trypsin-like peptidase domain-containing protein [Cohnella sp. LGH]
MGLFDDDFYSTRVRRRSRYWPRGSSRASGLRPGSTLRIALISSLTSSVLVAALFLLWGGGGRSPEPESMPAIAGGQSYVETSERIISASEKVRPAVVSIINLTTQALELQEAGDFEEGELPYNTSMGSGVIFKKQGDKAYIITNAHVIQDAGEIQAVLVGGERKKATIVGKDIITDLAVLEVGADGINTVVELGHSDKLRVGEMVIAIGNPLGFGDSLTQGIVSSTKRIIPVSINQDGNYDWEQEVIQTDAAINQGNSGGALVDLNGKLVGINSMKVADRGVEGIGFAIPIDQAVPVLNALMEKGKVSRPYLGVYTMNLGYYLDGIEMNGLDDPDEEEGSEDTGELREETDGEAFEPAEPVVPKGVTKGVIVLEAVGPSLDAGLKFNDIIIALDSTAIGSTLDLRKYLYHSKKIGDSLKVTYYRDGKKHTLDVKLTEKADAQE